MTIRVTRPSTLKIIGELAARTGEDPVDAVYIAVCEKLARLKHDNKLQRDENQEPSAQKTNDD